ncbi:MAG TPA: HDOD domain-containing protein [Tepidisphaeraceae bacterium]|jgi:HD-like signal output (HDOD) protein|nr:HDOD domain-containing protein [Tepidisphaeraceae bacterium]
MTRTFPPAKAAPRFTAGSARSGEMTFREQILGHCTFPALPAAAIHILRLAERRSVGLDELAEVIAGDDALASAVIRAINSNFYGLRRKVTTVRQAVATLGLQSVQTLVLGLSLASTLPCQTRGASLSAYWRRCVYSAAAARAIAARFLPGNVEECFIAALLMDLGTLVIDQALGERYAMVSSRAKSHTELATIETDSLQANHAEVGAMLVRQWGLPAALEIPVAAHHNPQSVENHRLRSIAEILELAGRCAEVFLSDHPAEAIAAARDGLGVRHGAGVAEADKLLSRVGQKATELAPFLRVTLASSDYGALLEKSTPRLLELALNRRAARTSNQRRSQRLAREGTLPLYPCARGVLGREMRVRLRDLSACGIGVIHSKAMSRGSQFVICLPQPGGSAKSLLYTAVRCESAGSKFHIGAELRSVLRAGEAADGKDEDFEEGNPCGAD